MARFVEGMDRGQATLLPVCLEDWVDENNPVRAVDVFVDALDLVELGFDSAQPMATGRPGYKPSVLLKLYIYGYLNRVQSSRQLEREAGRNLEVMWLTGRLAPDHKLSPISARTMVRQSRRCVHNSSSYAARWDCWRKPAWPSMAASSRRSTAATTISPRASWSGGWSRTRRGGAAKWGNTKPPPRKREL